MQQIINAAGSGLGVKLTATDTLGHLGCGHCRARPRGAGRARSDLLWANLTGGMRDKYKNNSLRLTLRSDFI